ncbi:hypothetical protein DL769_005931 [Monosporascus sp. CRB-8-3]|nr:hypothetical protein DL769_005931 [Monosporascus sp. CRB-8-3]
MLVVADEDGMLTEVGDQHLHVEIDREFKTTVIDFFFASVAYKPHVAEISVGDFLKNPKYSQYPCGAVPSFRWLHFPANIVGSTPGSMTSSLNGLYDNPVSAYGVLKPERWVRRQHRGPTGEHRARFMIPHCQAFPSASPSSVTLEALERDETGYRADLVLFRKVLKVMDGIVKSASVPGARNASFEMADSVTTPDEEVSEAKTGKPLDKSRATDGVDVRVNRGGGYTSQWATAIWGIRNDPDDFSLLLAMVKASIDEINHMIERAEKAKRAVNFLVDLKLKQNSVMDAKELLKQGRIVLVFTVTTIVFLPLSFMATFLTLNISQFQTNSEGELDLSYVLKIIFSAILISIAFKMEHIKAAWNWATANVSRKRELTIIMPNKGRRVRSIPFPLQEPPTILASDPEAQKGVAGSHATGGPGLMSSESRGQSD